MSNTEIWFICQKTRRLGMMKLLFFSCHPMVQAVEFPPRPSSLSEEEQINESLRRIQEVVATFNAHGNRPPADRAAAEQLYENLYQRVIDIFRTTGAEFVENGGAMLQRTNPQLLIRREQLPNLVEAIARHRPLALAADLAASPEGKKEEYDNCAVFTDAGVKMSAEGLNHTGGVAAFLIFRPDGDHLRVIDRHQSPKPDAAGRDRSAARLAEGEILPEDVESVVLRFPRAKVAEEMLTEEELDREPPYIYRGFRFLPTEQDSQTIH